ncbi:MAG: hypothetical protein RPU64_03600 [Candidatus Sedimenticola sp. (ex Thyasira tokunagai)]
MAVLTKGNFSINLGIFKVSGDLSDDDRQCAWELYTEIVTRLAVHGRPDSGQPIKEQFKGELYMESLTSLYSFFGEMRGIMRKFPVGKIECPNEYHLGKFTCEIMNNILRPFLEKWQGDFRHWYDVTSRKRSDDSPFLLQDDYPELDAFIEDWSNLRSLMQSVAKTLANEYQLVHSTGN